MRDDVGRDDEREEETAEIDNIPDVPEVLMPFFCYRELPVFPHQLQSDERRTYYHTEDAPKGCHTALFYTSELIIAEPQEN